MLGVVRLLWVCCALLIAAALSAQDETPKRDLAYQMFSGSVVEVSTDKLTVTRTLAGKPAEKRTFLMTAETKVEGRLRPKARVTVGYTSNDRGDVAVRIIVRPSTPAPPPKKK